LAGTGYATIKLGSVVNGVMVRVGDGSFVCVIVEVAVVVKVIVGENVVVKVADGVGVQE
jgi:hypothetical protein